MVSNSFFQNSVTAQNFSTDSAAQLLSISLASVPVLSAIIMMRLMLHQAEQLGVISEEVFRGERLPVLPFPDQS